MKRRQFLDHVVKAGGIIVLAPHFPNFDVSSKLTKPNNRLGIALVGLGSYATNRLAPALQETKYCYLAGIVTGTPEKEKIWSEKYNIPEKNIYNYKNFDNIANNKDINIVYVVLPNSMHAEYTIRAAEAGKHVISEKPMATSVEGCQKMIEACNKAKKQLSIGYRLYYDPFNLKMMEIGQHQKYGKLQNMSAGFAFNLTNPSAWRLNKNLAGGGPLMDLGIYCLEASIYTSGELPVQVTAKNETKNKSFFKEVEGTLEWEMSFPSGLKSRCMTSYEDKANFLKAEAEKGVFSLEPAYSYKGNQGVTPEGPMRLNDINQQALQMDAFAQCIIQQKPSIMPGEMGMRDMYLINKIYEAAESGKAVSLNGIPKMLYKI